jgi:hypothetical protein
LCLDFIVVAYCARKAIRSAISNGNGESFLGKNILQSNCIVVVHNETILRDCDIPVGSGSARIPFWITKALGLKRMSLLREIKF